MNVVISVEKLNDVSICPRLYNYKHLLAKVPVKKADTLSEGELMHEGLKIYYQSIIAGKRLEADSVIELTRNYATGLQLPVAQVEETVKDLRMYLNYYGTNESWEIEAAEEPFAKILYEAKDLTIVLNGKIDLRVKTNYGKGPRAIVDHKYEAEFREKRDRDNQALAYSWAYETKDWIYNRIGKQKSYEPEKRLQRPYFCYSQHQIDEWKESAIDAAIDLVRYEHHGRWPARYTGCTFYFGKKCTFYDICNTTPDNRAYKLDQLFIDKDKKTSVMER